MLRVKEVGRWAPKFWFGGHWLSNLYESRGRHRPLSLSLSLSWCILHLSFDCVWLLDKVSALVLVQFRVRMPQIVHIMP